MEEEKNVELEEVKDTELTCGNSYRVCGNECCDPTGPVPGELPRY